MTEKEWIASVAPAAVKAQDKYGYLASVLIGQTCQETGYGTRPLVRYKNIIGMKTVLLPYDSETWGGRSVVTGTWEEVSGKRVDKPDSFRKYDSYEDCLMDYCQFMRDGKLGGRYKYRDVLAIKDPEKLIKAVNGRGYATDSGYAAAVMRIIKKYDLTQYDKEDRVHYISNCGHDERGQYTGGEAGDQTGAEWAIRSWYSRPWDVVLEPPTRLAADTIAELAIEAANNNLVGYDQGNRTSFDAMLLKYGNYPKGIREACETDCSAGVAAIVRATGRILGIKEMQDVSKDAYTGNLEKALTAAGFIAHREERYLDSPDYLGNGWVLLYTGHHAAVSVSRGAKWEDRMSVTKTAFLVKVKEVAEEARAKGWRYGDSKGVPPCEDGIISCDRLVSRALWLLGVTGQPAGGWNCVQLVENLPLVGFTRITEKSKVQSGDVVLVGKGPDKYYHAFVVAAYDPATDRCNKYDEGSDDRIRTEQPFRTVPLVEWSDRYFSVAFRPADDPAPIKSKKDLVKEGQEALNKHFGAGLKVDGDRGKLTDTAFLKAFQTALNKDYYLDGEMPVNGKLTRLTRAALGSHYVERGEKQQLVTIVEIGMLLSGKDPKGVELPGEYGPGLQAATGKARMSAEDILKLF